MFGNEERARLLEILDAGLRAADGRRLTRDFLRHRTPGPAHLIAVGKAAAAMSLGAAEALGPDLLDGYVVTRAGYDLPALSAVTGLCRVESSHPVPDQASLDAGDGLLAYAASLPPASRVLVLISGGASSLVETLRRGVGADDLVRLNRWLLASGLDIFDVNAVRRRISRLKDGGLARVLGRRPVLALYLSDVEGDDPAWIGSGLLKPATCSLPAGLPGWLEDLARRDPAGKPPPALVEHHVIGNLASALEGCENRARALGYPVTRHARWLKGPVDEAARRVLTGLERGPAGIHVWGGETTIALPPGPGRGGRNQHLALACAVAIEGRPDLAVLCCATDGADGPGEDAGGLVDGYTVQRGRDAGADPGDCLARADSGAFLEAAGDLVCTGPTSTNVNDVVIGLAPGSG